MKALLRIINTIRLIICTIRLHTDKINPGSNFIDCYNYLACVYIFKISPYREQLFFHLENA